MSTGTSISVQASINSSEFYPAEVQFGANVEYVRSETAVKPDPAWEHADSNGHFHAFAADGKTPTLTTYSIHIDCDGSCAGICGGEGYDDLRWKCAICGEAVEPRFIPDEGARYPGIPVETLRWAKVTVRGTGPLPQAGQQDNGDGTFTLNSAPSRVTVRVRAESGELVGTGYASMSAIYRSGRAEWTVTIDGAPLLPRLAQPERERVP